MRRMAVSCLWVLLASCAANPNSGSSAEEAPPEGSPEALMDALSGGRPRPKPNLAELDKHPLGSQRNPVRVGGPAGERAYLARLRCADGRYPEFQREGSFGPGPWGYILDGYSVKCASGQEALVFMDMYHSRHQEDRAVPGFTIEPLAPN
jgi:hypothetical protein